ncbi:hypothetical protein N9L02_02890, partial [Gammaproteobacteria bacterium]|nr:hypothetical protein [Gammaproteobacteria bacterium]
GCISYPEHNSGNVAWVNDSNVQHSPLHCIGIALMFSNLISSKNIKPNLNINYNQLTQQDEPSLKNNCVIL